KELNLLASHNIQAISQRQSNEIKAYLESQERFISILALTSDVVRSLVVLNRIQASNPASTQEMSQTEELRQSFTPILKSVVDQFDFRQLYLINTNGDINL